MAGSAQVYYDRAGVATRSAPAARPDGNPMIDTDDLEPKRKAPEQPDFETMSIEELHDYIAELEGTRAELSTGWQSYTHNLGLVAAICQNRVRRPAHCA